MIESHPTRPVGAEREWFSDLARVSALCRAASAWIGTPWAANSAVAGPDGGVSCHHLPRALLVEVGALPSTFPAPKSDPNATRHGQVSVIERWLDRCVEFKSIPIPATLSDDCPTDLASGFLPGDLLGLRIYRCVDHLGIVLRPPLFLHVLQHQRTTVNPWTDPTWSRRLLRCWRLDKNT